MRISDEVMAELRTRGHAVESPVTGDVIVDGVIIDSATWDEWAGRGAGYIAYMVALETRRCEGL